jgi:hypothetical protein
MLNTIFQFKCKSNGAKQHNGLTNYGQQVEMPSAKYYRQTSATIPSVSQEKRAAG